MCFHLQSVCKALIFFGALLISYSTFGNAEAHLQESYANCPNNADQSWQQPQIELSEALLAKSILNYGDLSMMKQIVAKLKARICINVEIIGCSPACGSGLPSRSYAYAHRLFEDLNRKFPCIVNSTNRGFHQVGVDCLGGKPASYFTEFLSSDLDKFNQTDLFLFDTSVCDALFINGGNGLIGYEDSAQDHLAASIDALAAMVLIRPPYAHNIWSGRAIIWLTTSSVGKIGLDVVIYPWDGSPSTPRWADAVPTVLPIMRHHGIPMLSAVDALGPFRTQTAKDWFYNKFLADKWLHPGVAVHFLISDMVMNFLDIVYDSMDKLLPWEVEVADYEPRAPFKAENMTVRMFVDAQPFHMHLHGQGGQYDNPAWFSHMVGGKPCADWAVGEAKPGYISKSINATCGWLINQSEVAEHVVYGEIHVMMMKSYEHMGIMGISLQAVGLPQCANATIQMEPRLLNSTSVDLLWTVHASMGHTEQMYFPIPPAGACLLINVTVLPSSRAENKVKFLGFNIF